MSAATDSSVSYTELPSVPGLLGLYARAASESLPLVGASRNGKSMPNSGLAVRGVRVDANNLGNYARVCGLRLREELPLTYPFALTFPLAMQIMTGPRFPFPAMGSVHLTNLIETTRPLLVGEELDFRVHAENLRETPSGLLVDMVSEIRGSGEEQPAWTQRSAFLSKRRTSLTPPKGSPRPPRPEPPTAAELGVPTVVRTVTPAEIATYAAVAGDRNPIHISRIGAKAFGFPGIIAHGMWTAAALLGTVEGKIGDQARYHVEFGKPVVLPAKIAIYAREGLEASSEAEGTPGAEGSSSDANSEGWTITVRKASNPGIRHASATLSA